MTFKPRAYLEMEAKWRGEKAIAEHVDIKTFKPKEWPPECVFVPILGKVFAARDGRYEGK